MKKLLLLFALGFIIATSTEAEGEENIVGNPEDTLPISSTPSPTPITTTTSTTSSTTTTIDPCVQRPVFTIRGDSYTHRWDKRSSFDKPIFSGAIPSCLPQILRSCGGNGDNLMKSSWQPIGPALAFSDDCLMGFLLTGQVKITYSAWWSFGGYSAAFVPWRPTPGVTVHRYACAEACYLVDFTVYLDSSCNRITKPTYTCGAGYNGTVSAIVSPISLEWEAVAGSKHRETIVQFPLVPGSSNKWFSWRASADFPLLVFDPQNTRQVKDATQLFGNFTFGKNWKNGFEALESMDRNKDAKLTGAELNSLSLWFDKDRNGISQASEVNTLKEAGVIALYVGSVEDKGDDSDIIQVHGFDRAIINGTVSGAMIDWFSRASLSKTEAAFELQRRRLAAGAITREEGKYQTALSAELTRRSKKQSTPSKAENLNGTWEWAVLDDNATTQAIEVLHKDPSGVLTIRDRGAMEIDGYTLLEIPNVITKERAVRAFLLLGQKNVNSKGSTVLTFEVETILGQLTRSQAELSADGNELRGVSSMPYGDEDNATVKYSWIARKIR